MMNTGLTVSNGRMGPCFSGVCLWIVEPDAAPSKRQIFETTSWQALDWGQELMRHNVRTLLCAGIDQFLWGALQGHGIKVVPDTIGTPEKIIEQWRKRELSIPQMWPPEIRNGCRRGFRRGRGRMERQGRGGWRTEGADDR
ncbi:MAG: hypothetical protein KAH23_00340 [Kiritimatiellae bacterium]|nr:hypothetical protein [Kiritimatiellia bacterium]